MWLSPSILLMILSVMTSVLLVASSSSLFISWMGLELNTLAFLPLLLSKKNKLTSESSIKYFLAQTLASVIVVAGGLSLLVWGEGGISKEMILLGLAIKLGAAPFHSWLITVAESLGWVPLFVLLTIQKLNPLLMVWNFSQSSSSLLYSIIFFSLALGALLGLAQTSTRALMTFSSINHVGWLLASSALSLQATLVYFTVYSTILLAPILLLYIANISHLNELPFVQLSLQHQYLFYFCLLSLGGLPPFLGFLPKWMILQLLMSISFYTLSLVMILMSLFTLFFYLRLMFTAFIFGGDKILQNKNLSLPLFTSFLLSLSVGGLSVVCIF